MCPAADRSVSREDVDATFLMVNMVPQAGDNNRVTWEHLESYCRDQARDGRRDLYITAGPAGKGAFGEAGFRAFLRGRRVVVPGKTWKVVLAVPAGTTDPKKVTAEAARVWAVVVPNNQGISPDWRSYAVSVKDVEDLTGLTFFSNLPAEVARELKARPPQTTARGEKPPVAKGKKPKAGGKRSELELSGYEEGCTIGNRKSKKYHVPGGRGYARAKNSKNAAFFRDAKDAEAAGYVRAKR
jgi:hypothetical protein